MKKQVKEQSKQPTLDTHTEMSAGEKLWKEIQEMQYDYSKVGQSFVMP